MPLEPAVGATVAAGALLGGAGASVLAVETFRRRPLRTSALVKRWCTWTVLALLWLAGLTHPAILMLVLAGIGTASAWEYNRLFQLPKVDRIALLAAPSLTLIVLGLGASFGMVLPLILLIATLPAQVASDVEAGPDRIGRLLVGVIVAVIPPGAIWAVGQTSSLALIALLFGVALSDVVAFVMGSILGGRKLAPVLSPNKTWSGAAGNLVGAAAGVAIASRIGPLHGFVMAVLPFVIAVGSIWGDLFESLLKRSAGVKDAGSVLPGFGGVLDRFDSVIVAAPLLWLTISGMEQML